MSCGGVLVGFIFALFSIDKEDAIEKILMTNFSVFKTVTVSQSFFKFAMVYLFQTL